MVDNSTSTAPYPKLDAATYFQTSNLQSEALKNTISKLNQEVSTDQIWRENVSDSNASIITYLKMVLGNADPDSNLQKTVWNSVAAVGEGLES